MEHDEHISRYDSEHAETIEPDDFSAPPDSGPHTATMAGEMPATVGPYEVKREIARGGMGVVYLGVRRDGRFHRRVALKVMKRGLDTDEVLRRFELERQLLGALNHPNIARLYDAGVTADGLPYFAMEYVDGQPVDRFCDRNSLNVEQRLRLFQQICAAAQYAHRNLVVHRDLKPSNILVNSEGVPKLLDFGIAKLINPELSMATGDHTAPDKRMMTPEYASPEQVRGEQVTTATDVYSLGVILYELLTGHRPYRLTRRVRSEIERVVLEVEPQRPSTVVTRKEEIPDTEETDRGGTRTITPESVSRARGERPERLRRTLEGDIDVIVLKALRKEPQQRYQTVDDFNDDIERYLSGLPVTARPQSMTYRAGKFVRRNKAMVSVAAMVVIAVGLAIALAFNAQAREAAEALADAQATEAAAARERADAAREAAERRAAQVRELTRFYLTELHNEVAPMPGSLSVRELIVEKAMNDLEVLAAEAEREKDPQLDLELAVAYDQLGGVQASVRNPSLGTAAHAKVSYEKSRDYSQRVLEAIPDHDQAMLQLSVVSVHLGDLSDAAGEYEESLTHYQEALRLAEDVVRKSADEPSARRQQAVALLEVGQALRRLERDDDAEESIRRSIALREALADEQPGDVRAQRDLSTGYNQLASLEAGRQRLASAQDLYERSLVIRERLREIDDEANRAARDVATQYLLVGNVCRERNELDCAQKHLQAYIDLTLQLAEANPLDRRSFSDLRRAHDWITHLRRLTNDDDAAIENFSHYHAALERMVSGNPSDLSRRKLLLLNEFLLARALNANGRYPEAVDMFDLALETAVMVAQRSGDAVDRIAHAEVLIESAPVFAHDGQQARSRGNLERALEVLDGLPENIRDRDDAQAARVQARLLLDQMDV